LHALDDYNRVVVSAVGLECWLTSQLC